MIGVCCRVFWKLFQPQISTASVHYRLLKATHYSSFSKGKLLLHQDHLKYNFTTEREFSSSAKKTGRMYDVILGSPLSVLGTISLGLILPSICGFYALFYISPEIIVRLGLKYEMLKAGMKEKYVQKGDTVFCYGEKNKPSADKPTLVFIHGFTSTKFQWLSVFKCLRPSCHMVAMELPGHGNSSIPGNDVDLSIDFMESSILTFLELVGLSDKKVHLIGSSLGGALAGVVAARNPDKVCKVTMICPAMNTPTESDFLLSLKKVLMKDPNKITYSDCALIPQDLKGIKHMFQMCMYNKKAADLHEQVYQGLLSMRIPKNDFFLRLFKASNTDENLNLLAKFAPSITMPSQVIWGRHDEVMDMSGAKYLQGILPDCKMMDVVEKCGHAVDMDRPGTLCKLIGQFILNKQE